MIIPTLNEAPGIASLLASLHREDPGLEIIVADGGSTDGTRAAVRGSGRVIWVDAPAGRARQMNAGAAQATGDILVFLHADTRLSPGWPHQVAAAAARPDFALGAFPFQLDQPGTAYRIIEWAVKWRCRLFHMPYGDQALFITRAAFSAAKGYRDLPLMEDVDLVRRLRNSGALVLAQGAATTSARRWQQRGVCRQTWTNWTTYLLYRWGASPSQLARRYRGIARNAIAVFCKYPTPGTVKTRLAATEGQEVATQVYRTLVRHTLDTIAPLATAATPYAFFTPIEAADDVPGWLGPGLQYRAQGQGDLGDRMLGAFRHTLGAGADRTLIIGTDCPGLTTAHLQRAFAALDTADVVLGPTHDGGYYLIGMHSPPQQALFRDIPWSTHNVLSRTLAAAENLDLRVTLLDTLHDLDNAEDLDTARRSGTLEI